MKRLMCMMAALLVLLLAACDSGGSGGGPGVTSAQPDPAALSDPLLVEPGAAVFAVTGAVELGVVSPEIRYAAGDFGPDLRLILEIGQQGGGYMVRFVHRAGLPPGTYTLGDLTAAAQGDTPGAGLLYLLSPDAGRQYRENVAGTLTLLESETSQSITGSFEFTARSSTGDTVIVRGTFNSVVFAP